MGSLTEEYFDTLKARYVKCLIYRFENYNKQSRDEEYSSSAFLLLHSFILASQNNNTVQLITSHFDMLYRLGFKIEAIINKISEELLLKQQQHKQQAVYWQNPKTSIRYYKLLGLINLKGLKKDYFEFDETGNITKHLHYTYNFSFNSLIKFIASRGTSKKAQVFNTDICTIEYVINEPHKIDYWLLGEAITKDKIFKIAVKHKAQEDFSSYLRDRKVFNTEEEENYSSFKIVEIDYSTTDDIKNTKHEFTRARQVLAFFFLLEQLGLENEYVNKTDLARLLHLLSAQEIPKGKNGKDNLDNSVIYSALKNLSSKKINKNFIKDLEFIKAKISPLATDGAEGIQHIIASIEKELKELKK